MEGGLRGYVENPGVELPLNEKGKLDISRGIGIPGLLTVVKDIRMKEPVQTSLPLATGKWRRILPPTMCSPNNSLRGRAGGASGRRNRARVRGDT